MSVLLGLTFLGLSAIAVAVIAASLKRYAPGIAELRSGLDEPIPVEELRLTVRIALPGALPTPDPQPAMHEPKPIKQMLQARKAKTAIG